MDSARTPAPQDRPRTPASPLFKGLAAGVLVLAGFAAGYWAGHAGTPLNSPAGLQDLGPAPAYTLVNQWGKKVPSKAFAGKVQVVSFLFPYCTTYCPLITAHLIGFGRLVEQSGQADHVDIVAFNIAPGVAGPAQLREFLSQYGWDPRDPRWQFLTGTRAQIHRVVTDGFHVFYRRVSDQAGGGAPEDPDRGPQLAVYNPMAQKKNLDFDIVHNDAIMIVDARGRIRKLYSDADTVSGWDLWKAVKPLLAR